MATRKKFSQLDEIAALSIDDILAVSDDPSGSPVSKKAGIQKLVDLLEKGYFPRQVDNVSELSSEEASSGYVCIVGNLDNGGLFKAVSGGIVDNVNIFPSSTSGWTWQRIFDALIHLSDKDNPHEVDKTQVGLGNVDNTSDLDKPVSTAQQAAINSALDSKADTDLSNVDNESVDLAMLAPDVIALLGTGFDPALGQGDWNPATNTPTIPAAGTAGRWYRVSVAGTASGTNADGTYEVNDVVVDNGSSWVLFRFPTANIADGYITWAKFSDTLKKQVDKYTYYNKNEFSDPLFLFTGTERITDSDYADIVELNGVKCFKTEYTATAKAPRFYIPVDSSKTYNVSCVVQQKLGNQVTASNLKLRVFASATLGGGSIVGGLGGSQYQDVDLPLTEITTPTLYTIGENLSLDASANYIAFGVRIETTAAQVWISQITITEYGPAAPIYDRSENLIAETINTHSKIPTPASAFGKGVTNLLPTDLTDGGSFGNGTVYQAGQWVLDTGAGSGTVVEKSGVQTVKLGVTGDKALRCLVSIDNSQTDLTYSFAIHKDSIIGASSEFILVQYEATIGIPGELTRETVTLANNYTRETQDYYIYEGTVSIDSDANSALFFVKSVGSGNELYLSMASLAYGTVAGWLPKDVNAVAISNLQTTVNNLATDYLMPVDMPSGFDFSDYGFDILFDTEKRKFTTTLNPEDYKISGVDNTYYVSQTLGNDSTGSGTVGNPYKSFWKAAAVSKAAGDTKATIYLEEGIYQDANAFNSNAIDSTYPQFNIICLGSGPARLTTAVPASWSATLTNTFVATFALGSGTYDKVVDLGQLDSSGIPKLLTLVGSAAAVDALPGSYYMVVGGSEISVYVRLYDDATPTDSRVLVLDGSNYGDISGADRYLENVEFIGGSRALRVQGTTAHTIFFNRCKFHTSSSDNCLTVTGWGSGSLMILKDCGSFYGYNDNFNYHGSAGGKVIELDCYGHTSGLNTGLNSQNISTIHNGISIIRINPKFSNAQNRVIHDIGSGDSWNLGGVCGKTVTQSPDADSVAWLCGHPSGDTTRMWLDTCESRGGCAIDFGVHTGSTLYVRNCNISAYSGLITDGTIQRY